MASAIRKIPPICLFFSIILLLSRQLWLSKQYIGNTVPTDDNQKYTIFRHITLYKIRDTEQAVVFVVRFKFASLSHKANKIASIIPMLLITGFPGFHAKIYSVNYENGYWQGMYQWKSEQHLEAYKKSFVYRMMNKRAISTSIYSFDAEKQELTEFIKKMTSVN